MILTGILAGFLTFCALMVGFGVLYYVVKRHIKRFITAPDDQTPSRLALLVDTACNLLAVHLVNQIKASLNGMLSGESRAAAAEADAGNPIISILSSLGLPKKLARGLGSHPVVQNWANTKLMGIMEKMNNNNGGNKPPVNTAQTKLNM